MPHDHAHGHDHEHAHERAHAHEHAHARGHAHGHGGHHHHYGAAASSDEWRIAAACLLITLFMLVELAGGVLAGSLTLLADAGHMVSDAAALAMSWAALRIGRRPADAMRSYGYRRLEVLVAFANGCTLFAIALAIAFEAARRLTAPVAVLGRPMLIVAVAGLIANAIAFALLSGGRRENLNLRSAWLHVLGDLLGFAVTIIGAAVIVLTGWTPLDPLLSLAVTVLILRSALGIVRSSGHILLEGTPAGFDEAAVRSDLMASVPGVEDVHHVHVWCLTEEETFITLHVRGCADASIDTLVPAVTRRLEQRFGIAHATVQVDHAECADEQHANPPRVRA